MRYLLQLDLEATPELCRAGLAWVEDEFAKAYRPMSDSPQPYSELVVRSGTDRETAAANNLQWSDWPTGAAARAKFLSPALAEAAMEGRLPRGFCIKRLTDLPMLWSEQWGAIGLQAPAQVRAELR